MQLGKILVAPVIFTYRMSSLYYHVAVLVDGGKSFVFTNAAIGSRVVGKGSTIIKRAFPYLFSCQFPWALHHSGEVILKDYTSWVNCGGGG